ncbi:MAG: ADP-ribosylglycohydrolase [Clostridiales bacterium]|nr:ADP-ribosylglycohydrolase [Clostridiales bacterium]
MLGAIIGDIAGSIYEYSQIKRVTPVSVGNVIEEDGFYSDDTILTMAVADAILSKRDYGECLREWANRYSDYKPKHEPYFQTSFSPNFLKWAKDKYIGTSVGNGAMMRVSPVGYLFDTIEEVENNARMCTIPSHNTDEAISSAQMVAKIIFLARQGMSKEDIIADLGLSIKEPKISKFNYTCGDTVDVCLYSLFNSESFEDSIRTAISFGGDTDTNACIVGSMAEAMYGVPEELKKKAIAKLPPDMLDVVARFEEATSDRQIGNM